MNAADMTPHLTDDQIDEYLMGDLAAGPAAHLAACDPCLLRVAEAQAPIASFRAVSLAWSERRSSTLPAVPAGQSVAWRPRAAWGLAATALVALAVAFPMLTGRHGATGAVSEVAARPAAVAPADLAETPAATPDARTPGKMQPAVLMASTGGIGTLTPDEEMIHDNQLLRAVDHELSAPSDAPSLLGYEPAEPAEQSPTGGASLLN